MERSHGQRVGALCLSAGLFLVPRLVSAPAAQVGRGAGGGEPVVVVPVEGEIDFRTVALVQRGLREVEGRGAGRLVLAIDTPGGEIASMEEVVSLLRQLRDAQVQTLAFIRRQGFSAGAVIALACEQIYMAPGASIGACTPVFAGGMRGLVRDEVYRKWISAVRSEVRAIARHHGAKAALLAEAMVDPDLELHEVRYRGPDEVTHSELLTKDRLLGLKSGRVTILADRVLEPQPLTLTAEEALRFGLVHGLTPNLSELLRSVGSSPESIVRLKRTWSEELAGFLYGIRFFLLLGGILMAVFAFKMPGTGLPEALAVLCFALFFGGTWLVGLAAWTEILLFFGGVGLVLLELFVVPGTVVAGLLGLIAIVAALFLSLQPFVSPEGALESDLLTGNLWALCWVLLGVIVAGALLSKLLPHMPLFRNLLLERKRAGEHHTAATEEPLLSTLVGREGKAETDLRPAGRAEIGGEPYDVVTTGGYIVAGRRIKVIDVEGNRIVVEEVPASRDDAGVVSIPLLLLLLFFGFLAMTAEVFFPSFGVLSVVAGVSVISAVFLAFQHGTGVGFAFLIGVLITVPLVLAAAFKLLPRTRLGRHLILEGPNPGPGRRPAGEVGLETLVGKQGEALTPLRPAGTVLIDGRRYDAVTRGLAVEPGTRVEVLGIEMSQLVVAPSRPKD